MKRLMSIMLTMGMIIGLIALPSIGVSAATTGPIFDLYFEDYDGTEATTNEIINGIAGNESVITVTGAPGVVTETINGRAVKSLQISDISTGTANNKGYLKVADDIFTSTNTVTIESWFKWNPRIATNNWNHGNIFNITNGDQNDFKQSMQLKVLGNGDAGTVIQSGQWGVGYSTTWHHSVYANKWIHYVVKREYNETKKEWTVTQYINGVQMNQQYLTDTDKTKQDENFFMMIGYNLDPTKTSENEKWFHGNIGSFKVYDYALTATAIDEHFRAEQSTWLNEIDGHIIKLDLSGYGSKGKSNQFGLKNAIEGNTTNFRFPDTTNDTPKPELVVESTPYGERRYMRFSNETTSAKIGALHITDPSMMGEDALTIETWFKWDYKTSTTLGGLLRITGATGAEATNTLRIFDNDKKLWIRPYGNQSTASPSNQGPNLIGDTFNTTYPAWNHLAITRWYNETDSKWHARVFLNGELLGGQEYLHQVDPVSYLLEDNTYTFVAGTGNGTYLPQFRGSLGTLDVWNVARDDETIKASYNESKNLWQGEANDIFLDGLEFSDGEKTITSIDENTDSITARFKIGNGTSAAINPIVFLAYYEGDKLVKAAINNEISSVAASSNTGATPIEVKLTGLEPVANSKVKLFIWDATTLAPLMNVDSGMKLDFTPSL